jgi:hypothetical protein
MTGHRPPDRPCTCSADLLLTRVRTGTVGERRRALRHLRKLGPQPALLDLAGELVEFERLRGPLGDALDDLGLCAVPLARTWAAVPEHPMARAATCILADHGDESDVPALLAGWDRLDAHDTGRCGYDRIADGLARIGGDAALTAVPRLRRAWFTPHSFERAATLRAYATLAPEAAVNQLTEGLWDCEAGVRSYAAARAPLGPVVRGRLAELRDDPLETAEVRAAAVARLAG